MIKFNRNEVIHMKCKKLRTLLLIPALAIMAVLIPAFSGGGTVAHAANDFEITDGVLTNYRGGGGNVTIPSGKVTAIADYAFYGCSGITGLTIPQGVKTIGKQAFANCSSMTSISIPKSVTSIGELSFNGCSKLTNIDVASGSAYFSSEGGILFSQDKTTLIRYPEGKNASSYSIPSSVTIIDKSAFSRCLALNGITLPSGLKTIRDNAFYEDTGITSLAIPSTVTSIGSEAFRSTTGLKTLTLEAKSPTFGKNAFKNTGVARILYAGSTTQWADANIGDVFGSTVKVYYEMSGFTVEDDVLVSYTGSAESVSVPGFIVRIDDRAFHDRTSMKSITLPTSLKYIDQAAFDNCTSLTRITIPSSVISIEKWAFDNCTSLEKISVATDNKFYSASGGVLYNRSKSELLRYPPALYDNSFTVPSTVVKIGDSAFSRCKNLGQVILPADLETIDHYAFDQCSSITDVTIPASVKTVGKYAFRSNRKLTSVTLMAISPFFDTGVFENSPIAKVFYSGTQAQWNSAKLGNVFGSSVSVNYDASEFERDGNTLVAYKGSDVSVTIPDYFTKIGPKAFSNNTALKSVTIPNSVTSIGESAFANCSALTGITIPASVDTIEKWAFDDCSNLTAITVSEGNRKFCSHEGVLYSKDMTKLLRYPPNKPGSSFTFPSSVRTICDSAFASCRNLTNLSAAYGVESIEQYAFDQCSALTGVTLSSTVSTVGKYAFRSNYKLKTVVILAKTISVSSNAFLSDPVAAVCFAGSESQWKAAGLSGIFDGNSTVYCNYKYPVITLQPQNITSVIGKSVTFSVGANGSGLNYQWYYKKRGQTSFSVWKGHTHALEKATPNNTWDGIQLRCVITDAAGVKVTSSAATVTLTPDIGITEQPKNITANQGKQITLSVSASGSGLKYQWYYKKVGQSSFSVWNGHTHATENVTPNETWDGIQLYCLIKNSYGESLKSDVMTVTIKKSIIITAQPQNMTIPKGTSITLSVKATGNRLTYQWYFKKKGQTAWTLWKGRTHASEDVTPNNTWDGIQLYCLIKASDGTWVKSNAAVIQFKTVLTITSQPQSKTVTPGDSVRISLKASGNNLKYQWYYKKKNASSFTLWKGRTGATETVTPNETWDGIQLYCTVTDDTGASVKTDTIKITLR